MKGFDRLKVRESGAAAVAGDIVEEVPDEEVVDDIEAVPDELDEITINEVVFPLILCFTSSANLNAK
ncbi:hypothetical protein ACS0TY_000279 [Phlomoides rotata]